ncbi:MAG: bifunctional 5,10-methylenetetrahydrofolate dehydrogenase/5,10-methenyltetrahydrofolate cyclohydrolase [Bacilli bacterium]
MIILDGKKVKEEMLKQLKEKLLLVNRPLGLTVIQVGNNSSSNVYVKQKEKMANYLNYNFKHLKLASNIKETELLNIIELENNNDLVDGIIVQLPLPKHLNPSIIQNKILPQKDIDGLTNLNSGKLVSNSDCLIPCTPLGILDILNYYHITITGKHVVIVGRSSLVGKPLLNLMLNNNATVTICHSKTTNLKDITNLADILIVAIGKKHFITSDMVKDNAVVIDVGINSENEKLYGDVDFDNVKDKCSYITPVPGGVGQMTVLEVGYNVYKAYQLKKKK